MGIFFKCNVKNTLLVVEFNFVTIIYNQLQN